MAQRLDPCSRSNEMATTETTGDNVGVKNRVGHVGQEHPNQIAALSWLTYDTTTSSGYVVTLSFAVLVRIVI